VCKEETKRGFDYRKVKIIMKRCVFLLLTLKKEALKMLQNITIITVVVIAAALAVKYLMRGGCNCCCNKAKKGLSCRTGYCLKK
jgi:hypothetical protein